MKSKKLLSIILALAMMFSVLPASTVLVYADVITETISADTTWNDGDTVGGVTISGGTVTINGDVGITAAITIKGDVKMCIRDRFNDVTENKGYIALLSAMGVLSGCLLYTSIRNSGSIIAAPSA